jgi:DNA polymerase-3 subunit alpha
VTNYIDLHNHTTFSSAMTAGDAYGSPTAVVERAVDMGWSAVAVTEHGWLGSAPAIYKLAKQAGIKPILGCELYVTPDFALGQTGKEFLSESFHLTVLALSKEGYQNLITWNTEAMRRPNFYRKPRISVMRMAEIAPWPLHHNVVLSGCLASELNVALQNANGSGIPLGIQYIEGMKMLFPNFYIELQDHYIEKFANERYAAYLDLIERERVQRAVLMKLARITNTPLILTNDSHMQRPQDRKAHIAMKATSWRNRDDAHVGTSDAQIAASYLKDYVYFGNYMRDMEKIADGGKIPQAALASIADIVAESDIQLDTLDNFSYSIPFSGYDDPIAKIRKRSAKRLSDLSRRYGPMAVERFEHELESMGDFAHYLLLMSDFIVAARKQGILTWTRGSAANSLLCYCLKIHDIDSIEYNLLFSRFFNPARKKLPDVDVDIDPERYDDFMSIVHEKMEKLVGEGQVVQISNWGTSANRSAFRTAASALGIPKEEQDEIAKLLPQMTDSEMADEGDVFFELREEYPELYELTNKIFDSVKNVSQHACGWIFGTNERRVEDWIPLYLIASSNTLVTQYDYASVEDFGLTKMDFLRLRSLTVCSRVLRSVGKSPLDFHKIPLDDEATFEMIRAGNVEGVHTLQGKEVGKGIVEMEAQNVHDLILAAALYRPANTRLDKDKLYVARRKGHEQVTYAHPILGKIAGSTFGVPVYQEQAMEIGYAVGMDDAGVDDIYQAIKKAKGAGRGAKKAFKQLKPKFVAAAKASGFKKAVRRAFWEFEFAFHGYSFNKGHASSYGILGYKMAYLKCHYPAEYYAHLLSVFPERMTYLASARAEGFKFLLPDINRSDFGFAIDKLVENGIRVGLAAIDGLGPVCTNEIIKGQPFYDYDDLLARTTRRALNAPRMAKLAALGALETIGVPKQSKNDDQTQFDLLGYTLAKPKALRGLQPKHIGERVSESGWKHRGRQKGLERTSGRSSVSKLFWIPENAPLKKEASPWAQVHTWLFTVIDENGLPFHLMVNEDKPYDAKLLKFLQSKCQGAAFVGEGMVRSPFKAGMPTGFRFFGIGGCYQNDPQIWGVSKRYKRAILELHELKKRARYGS